MPLQQHIAKPLEHLRMMLSESVTFQQLMGAANSDEALEKIFYGYAEGQNYSHETGAKAPKKYPRAIVATEDVDSGRSGTSSWNTSFQMSLLLEVTTLEADADESASGRYFAFLNRVEGVVDDLREAASDLMKLNLTRISTVVPPMLIDPTESENAADFVELGINELWLVHLLIEAGG